MKKQQLGLPMAWPPHEAFQWPGLSCMVTINLSAIIIWQMKRWWMKSVEETWRTGRDGERATERQSLAGRYRVTEPLYPQRVRSCCIPPLDKSKITDNDTLEFWPQVLAHGISESTQSSKSCTQEVICGHRPPETKISFIYWIAILSLLALQHPGLALDYLICTARQVRKCFLLNF